jgi:hypothetical protein
MRRLWTPSTIRYRSSAIAPSKAGRNKFRKLSCKGPRGAPASLMRYWRRRLKSSGLRVGQWWRSLHEAIGVRTRRRIAPAAAKPSAGRGGKLRGPYYVRALRRAALAGLAHPRYTARRSRATAEHAIASGSELIDLVMQKAQQLKHEVCDSILRQGQPRSPTVMETLVEIISSPSCPIRKDEKPKAEPAHVPAKHVLGLDPRVDLVRRQVHAPTRGSTALPGDITSLSDPGSLREPESPSDPGSLSEPGSPSEPISLESAVVRVAPARLTTRNGSRSLIASANLESAITEAIRKRAPGCESFVGVIVQPTRPKSRFDANWVVRGVKFGRADREKVNEAIATIVESMQREYSLADD